MAYLQFLHVVISCKISSILGTNLWEVQTTYLLTLQYIYFTVKIVLKMFDRIINFLSIRPDLWNFFRLRSVELILQLFSNIHSSKRKVYESWPTRRKAPQAFLDFYQKSQLKWFLLLWQKLKWQTTSISKLQDCICFCHGKMFAI